VEPPVTVLTPLDPRYPSRLRALRRPPASLSTRGGSLEADRVVAIVGSRECDANAADYARRLAADVARLGAVVASGGAVGIDAAAHLGALDACGRTWVVAGTGHEHCYPHHHAPLFETIGEGPGAMLWPFAPGCQGAFLRRNRVLVAMADAVVVIQAGNPSGALGAASCARAARKPVWVVPPPPWLEGFDGSRTLLEKGARPLLFHDAFLASVRLPGGSAEPKLGLRLSPCEDAVLRVISTNPLHVDEIASRANASAQAAAAALLTLALENVVVEGPPGFYCRRDGC
jgi:DNA processing protein